MKGVYISLRDFHPRKPDVFSLSLSTHISCGIIKLTKILIQSRKSRKSLLYTLKGVNMIKGPGFFFGYRSAFTPVDPRCREPLIQSKGGLQILKKKLSIVFGENKDFF